MRFSFANLSICQYFDSAAWISGNWSQATACFAHSSPAYFNVMIVFFLQFLADLLFIRVAN